MKDMKTRAKSLLITLFVLLSMLVSVVLAPHFLKQYTESICISNNENAWVTANVTPPQSYFCSQCRRQHHPRCKLYLSCV